MDVSPVWGECDQSPLVKGLVNTISVTFLSCDLICRGETNFLKLAS